MIRLYADANLHGAITQGLREQGRVFSGMVLVTLRDGIGVCVEDIALLAQVETMESLALQVLYVPF